MSGCPQVEGISLEGVTGLVEDSIAKGAVSEAAIAALQPKSYRLLGVCNPLAT